MDEEIENLKKQEQELLQQSAQMQHHIQSHYDSDTQKTLADIVVSEGKEVLQEVETRKFEEQYKGITELAGFIRNKKWLESMGIKSGENSNSPLIQGYLTLESTLSDGAKAAFLLPYLLEKKALNIISKEENEELKQICLLNPSELDLTKAIDGALINYSALGVVGEKDGIIASFQNAKRYRQPMIGCIDSEILAKGTNIAKQLGLPYKESLLNYADKDVEDR